ncbi:MAG: beta-ribofuranosylaminobenzene 5'-phosphate synthase [Methanimicrococcus sp.]|nr:beta-ribofuranosylaminobenzene 5'-phosphate synthase [Methanimicrococcus sp.]
MFEIKTPSRIHMTLIDMNGSFGRIDGSVGLALSDGGVWMRAKKSDVVTVTEWSDGSARETKSDFADYVQKVAQCILPKNTGIELEFLSPARQHVGLGSGTQIALSVATAVNDLYSLGKSVRELAQLTRRGGTSGVGVLAFERGGFIMDAGHKAETKSGFLPSSKSNASPADLMLRMDFPDWDVVVALPPACGISGNAEKNFFQKHCPIPIVDVQKVSHIILMQMIPSLVENEIEGFGNAVNALQKVGFKKYEVDIQPESVKATAALMLKSGLYGAGVSSFGPAVYGFSENKKQSEEIRSILLEKMPQGSDVLITKANNTGAKKHV